ncbi:membrane protein [Clostridia bacterium]|nr:membrane protein [Clostridia bacterium]
MAAIKNNKDERKPDIGGQAVIEGVMMKSPEAIAISVRTPDGRIARAYQRYEAPSKKRKWLGWPVIRGIVNMVLMLMLGVTTLDTSTKLLGLETEEPSKFEKWLSQKLGMGIEKLVMGVAVILALGLSLLLFMVIPNAIATGLNRLTTNLLIVNLGAGIVRVAILIGYIWLTGLIPDMKRVYMYHGAEHKTVHCHEAGLELTPENAKRFSTLHPRCGTSFLLLVMVISVLLGAIADQLIHLIFDITRLSFPLRLLRSFITLPLVAGVSYEALQGLAHSNSPLARALRWPGLMMQHLTTREPDLSMLEIAIDAMERAMNGNQVLQEADVAPIVINQTIVAPVEEVTPEPGVGHGPELEPA